EQIALILRTEVAVVRDTEIMVVGNEIENIFLQISACAGDDLHFVLPDHLSKRKPQLSRTHSAGKRNHHVMAIVELIDIAFGGINQTGGIKMPVVVEDEIRNRLVTHINCFYSIMVGY